MDLQAVRSLFDDQLRRDAQGAERTGDVVRANGDGGAWTGILWSDLDESTADAAIAAQQAHFTSLGRTFEWKTYAHDRPADLPDRLLAAGFVPEPPETLMVTDVSSQTGTPQLPPGVRIVEVDDPAGIDLMAAVHEEAFGTSSARLREQLLAQLAEDPGSVHFLLAMAGDKPVCSARMDLHTGTDFASLWGGGTAPAWRGKGIYRALITHRAALAADLGYRYLQVDASDQSRPILERLGFAALTVTTPYVYEVA
ncbi:GNAT family N-acetyltransferase [Streptomyces sp. NBC_01304]|uniref:GNAT family N-acetyltransferase n=1 Tax=Streptomyces sp. NBC_01304 TaxID=2903818 RepID=UPI002E125161|nr:GNAT family N-acetyltransferase [Streptomyces sp. NBC_01304]